MKGFIEVTYLSGLKILVNIRFIKKIVNSEISFDNHTDYVMESYEEIKELIKQAIKK